MSPAEREFRDYLSDILDNARKLKSFVGNPSFEDFQSDVRTQYVTATREIDVVIDRMPAIIARLDRKNLP